jgi:hypothetical protein
MKVNDFALIPTLTIEPILAAIARLVTIAKIIGTKIAP